MPRLARKDLNTQFLHVMVQGVNKENVFHNDKYKGLYLKILNEYNLNSGIIVLAYCVMTNHAHFAIHAKDIDKLSKIMHSVDTKYAKLYNNEHNRCGVLFRNRFHIEPIYSMKHLVNCINYIHQNPVKAKMVDKCGDYKFSSYNDYKTNTGVAQNEIIKKLFGENCNFMKMFVKEGGKMFMDVEKPTLTEINEHIMNGTKEFVEMNNKKIYEIFSERNTLKALIKYLKQECGISYVNLMRFFEMTHGVMDGLKID